MDLRKIIKPDLPHISQIIAFTGFISIFILSIIIEDLKFNPGTTLLTNEGTLPLFSFGKSLHTNWLINLFLMSVFAMFPLVVIMLIFSSEARSLFKKYFKALIIWFSFLLGVCSFVLLFNQENYLEANAISNSSLPVVSYPPSLQATEMASAIKIYSPPSLPDWLGYMIGFFVAVVLGLLIYYFWVLQRTDDDIKTIALKTITDINQGRQWEDAIIQCYAEMNEAVNCRKRINRKVFLTPVDLNLRRNNIFPSRKQGNPQLNVDLKEVVNYLETITEQ